MLDKPFVSEFSHVKPGDTDFTTDGALRDTATSASRPRPAGG
jgi:hypothetical protein